MSAIYLAKNHQKPAKRHINTGLNILDFVSLNTVEATTEDVVAATSKVIILPKGEKGKFVLKGQLGKDKAVIAFSILNDSGEIIHN